MQLNGFQNFAIRGTNVTGFSLTNSVINGVNGTTQLGGSEEDSIRFDDSGEGVNATPALIQVQNGKPVVVGPAKYAEAKPVFPVPKWKG